MTVLILGGSRSGKSDFAQQIVLTMAGGGTHYYLATMIPGDWEDDARVESHLQRRAGMGFETVECFGDIMGISDREGAFLVDSVTSLMQNALFPVEKNYEMDLVAAKRCADALVKFAGTVRHAVFVSDYIYSDAGRYSESTETYRKCLAEADRRLARVCDTVIEVSGGQVIIHKGGMPI